MKKTAFTLIELLVVIVIIGVLATISVAQFNEYQEKARQAKSIAFNAQLVTQLRAQSTAAEMGATFGLNFEQNAIELLNLAQPIVSYDITSNTALEISADTPFGSGHSLKTTDGQQSFEVENDSLYPTNEFTLSFFIQLHNYDRSLNSTLLKLGNLLNMPRTGSDGTRLRFYLPGVGGLADSVQVPGTLSLKKWYHFTAVFDGSDLIIYKDGTEISRKTQPIDGSWSANYDIVRQVVLGPGGDIGSVSFDEVWVFPIAYDPS